MRRLWLASIAISITSNFAFAQSYTISTVVGRSVIVEGGNATDQPLPNLSSAAVDSAGNIYIAAPVRNRIYKVTPSGVLTTFAGTSAGYSGDGGQVTRAKLHDPQSVAVDPAGNVYISDSTNRRIRKVDTSGVITTIAGNGTNGFG